MPDDPIGKPQSLYLISNPATSDDISIEEWLTQDNLRRRGLEPELPLDHKWSTKQRTATLNIQHLIESLGPESAGHLTLTFRSKITARAAGKRIAKFMRTFRKHFRHWIRVTELTKKGQLHYHMVIQFHRDISTGTDLDAVRQYRTACEDATKGDHPLSWSVRKKLRDGTSTNEFLQLLWHELDESVVKLGFGWEFDLFPVMEPVGMSCYLAKDLVQRFPFLTARGRNVQAIRYSKGCPRRVPIKKERSKWFNLAVHALLGACGQTEESYLKTRLGNPKWYYVIGKVLGPELQRFASNWWGLGGTQLAQMIIELCDGCMHLSHYCSGILDDLRLQAALPICLAPPAGPHPMAHDW